MNLVIDYLRLRRAVGALGVLLPVALLLVAGPQDSLSAYYATPARDLFVGVLWTIGALLLAYRGHDRGDRIVSAVSGLALLLVAMAPVGGPAHALHVGAAVVFFTSTAAMCERFGRGGYRRRTFLGLGATILLALLAAAAGAPLLLAESVAVVAFGAAWLLKGRALETAFR